MANCYKCGSWFLDGSAHSCPSVNWISTGPTWLQYEALNDLVGVEPFKTDAVEKNVVKGFASVKQKVSLTPLKVIYGTEKIPPGATVWVRGDLCVDPEAKRVFEIEGISVSFIPVREVRVVKRWDSPQYSWTLTPPATPFVTVQAESVEDK